MPSAASNLSGAQGVLADMSDAAAPAAEAMLASDASVGLDRRSAVGGACKGFGR